MKTLPPLRPGTEEAVSPLLRWMVIIWLGFTIIGLLALGAALIWTGWGTGPSPADDGVLPQTLIPLLALPVAVAVVAYGVTIWRAWRRKPAVEAWLVGIGAHLTYLLVGAALVGEISVAATVTWDNFVTFMSLALPGLLLLNIERSRLENPLQP